MVSPNETPPRGLFAKQIGYPAQVSHRAGLGINQSLGLLFPEKKDKKW